MSVAQNSGIRIKAFDPLGVRTTYYRYIQNIWELDYGARLQIPIFKCNTKKYRKRLRSWPKIWLFEPLLGWSIGDRGCKHLIKTRPFYNSHAWFGGRMDHVWIVYFWPLDGLGFIRQGYRRRFSLPVIVPVQPLFSRSLSLCAASARVLALCPPSKRIEEVAIERKIKQGIFVFL
jgi:hypothetical protein